jgi:MFS family permease
MQISSVDTHGVSRWKYLTMACTILWSLSYCFDTPAAVHDHLEHDSRLSSTDFPWFFNSLYAAYSLPNLLLPLLFGYLSDSTAVASLIVGLAATSFVGQFFLYTGIKLHSDWLAILGRFVFGVGCESLGVALSSVLTHFFQEKELAFALAVSIASARVGMRNDFPILQILRNCH